MDKLALGIGFVLVLAAILLGLIAPEVSHYSLSFFFLGVFSLAFAGRRLYKRKRLFNEIISLILTICILGILNYLVIRNNVYFDFTRAKLYTLSQKSKHILNQFEQPLELTLFAKRSDWESFLPLLRLYEKQSSQVKIDAIDPLKNPMAAAKGNIYQENSLLIKYGDKQQVLEKISELTLTNQLLSLISDKKRLLCYSSKQGGFDFAGTQSNGLAFLKQQLHNDGFSLKEVDFLKLDESSLCDTILMIGVQKDLDPIELDNLDLLRKKGIGFMLAIGPNFSEFSRVHLMKLMNSLGVKFVNSVIVNQLSSVHKLDASINVIDEYTDHPIVENFQERTYFPLNAYVAPMDEGAALFYSPAFPAAWAETDLDSLQQGKAIYNESDIQEKVSGAVAVDSLGRTVVFGSDRFVLNGYSGQKPHFNLFLNALNWILNEEKVISLDRPKLRSERLDLSTPALNTIFYLVIILLPFAFFLMAGIVYQRNRR